MRAAAKMVGFHDHPTRASPMTSNSKTILIVAAVLISLPILMCGGCLTIAFIAAPSEEEMARIRERSAAVAEDPEEAADATPQAPSLTAETYRQVSEGMTYDEVIAIVGPPAEELSSNELGGTRTVMYGWKGGILANANMTFQNGKLVSKAQFGL